MKQNYFPDITNGLQTDFQTAREFTFLFSHVLNGYGLPYQLHKFASAIFTLTKPGLKYRISDHQIAACLGDTSTNYVVSLRKKYKSWCSEGTDGIRNFQFITVIENSYDFKNKRQLATEYEFSIELTDLLENLWNKARKHLQYKRNWIIAIKETCFQNREKLLEFGSWTQRKRKAERSADKVFETLLRHFKNHVSRTLEFVRDQGGNPAEFKETLKNLIDQAFDEMIFKLPKPIEITFNGQTIIFGLGDNTNNVNIRSSNEFGDSHTNRCEESGLVSDTKPVSNIRIMPRIATKSNLVAERVLYGEKVSGTKANGNKPGG